MRYPLKYPIVRVNIEVPYEDYKKLVQLKGDKTWRQILLEWYEMVSKEEVKR